MKFLFSFLKWILFICLGAGIILTVRLLLDYFLPGLEEYLEHNIITLLIMMFYIIGVMVKELTTNLKQHDVIEAVLHNHKNAINDSQIKIKDLISTTKSDKKELVAHSKLLDIILSDMDKLEKALSSDDQKYIQLKNYIRNKRLTIVEKRNIFHTEQKERRDRLRANSKVNNNLTTNVDEPEKQ